MIQIDTLINKVGDKAGDTVVTKLVTRREVQKSQKTRKVPVLKKNKSRKVI